MSDPISEACKLCGVQGTREVDQFDDVVHIKSCRCSEFWLDRCDYEDCLDNTKWLTEDSRRELSALLREQTIRFGQSVLLQINDKARRDSVRGRVSLSYEDLVATWPESVADRLDRVLLNVAALSTSGGADIWLSDEKRRPSPLDLALLFARNDREAQFHAKALIEQEYLESTFPKSIDHVVVTPRGWARVAELQASHGSPDDPPFVAMWFGGDTQRDEMDAVFEAIRKACEATKWRTPIRADAEQHNDFIMDKILGDIRRVPFVIADFTGNCKGVYIEAGFARGLGKSVIHTCKDSDFEEAHFDIKQIRTIKWKTFNELREGVTQRIRGSRIGECPKPHTRRKS